MLEAGIAVIDPGPVTKANTRVHDVHHHWEIFTPKILVPFLGALEELCGAPKADGAPKHPFSAAALLKNLHLDLATRRSFSVARDGRQTVAAAQLIATQ